MILIVLSFKCLTPTNLSSGVFRDTVEMLSDPDIGWDFNDDMRLPEGRSRHCMATFDQGTKILIAGGRYDRDFFKTAFYKDFFKVQFIYCVKLENKGVYVINYGFCPSTHTVRGLMSIPLQPMCLTSPLLEMVG